MIQQWILAIDPKYMKTNVHTETYIWMFIAALYVIGKN